MFKSCSHCLVNKEAADDGSVILSSGRYFLPLKLAMRKFRFCGPKIYRMCTSAATKKKNPVNAAQISIARFSMDLFLGQADVFPLRQEARPRKLYF